MSIFKTQAKKFTTTVTGEPLELSINNMVWITLRDKFGITQREYGEASSDENIIMSIRFLTSLLIANGYDVTVDEVAEHTDQASIMAFNIEYNEALNEELGKIIDEQEKRTKERAKANKKK